MTKSQSLFWDEMREEAIKMLDERSDYYEIKCHIIDMAIINDIDSDYSIRELYLMVTNVTMDAYRIVNNM